jgi:hypothetical protein
MNFCRVALISTILLYLGSVEVGRGQASSDFEKSSDQWATFDSKVRLWVEYFANMESESTLADLGKWETEAQLLETSAIPNYQLAVTFDSPARLAGWLIAMESVQDPDRFADVLAMKTSQANWYKVISSNDKFRRPPHWAEGPPLTVREMLAYTLARRMKVPF